MQCWGANGRGQLGRVTGGSTNDVFGAAVVPGLTDVDLLVASSYHACAHGRYQTEPGVWCWGDPQGFSLGVTTAVGIGQVVAPGLPSSFAAAVTAMGADGDNSGGVTCAANDDEAYCFGLHAPGHDPGNPAVVHESALDTATRLYVSIAGVCGRLAAGTVCVAPGTALQALGCMNGTACAALALAEELVVSAENVCLRTGTSLECSGANDYGVVTPGVPTAATLAMAPVGTGHHVQLGTHHVCAIDGSEAPVCWGHWLWGNLGVPEGSPGRVACPPGGSADCYGVTPVDLPASVSTVGSVGTFQTRSCAIASGGGVLCWGSELAATLPPHIVVLSP